MIHAQRSRFVMLCLAFALCAFLVVGFLGMPHWGMDMGSTDQMMANCPFMSGQAVICTMDPLEHIAAWKSMFNVFVQTSVSVLVLLLLSIGIARAWHVLWRLRDITTLIAVYRAHSFVCQTPSFQLQEAYASGVLNPKVF